MCFISTNLNKCYTYKDIVVYKIMNKNNISQIMLHKYEKNVHNEHIIINPTHTFIPRLKGLFYVINKGYHSYTNIKEALCKIIISKIDSIDFINGRLKISKFIIPKGTICYINDKNEIVSENIIYKSDVNLFRIKLFHYGQYRKIKCI